MTMNADANNPISYLDELLESFSYDEIDQLIYTLWQGFLQSELSGTQASDISYITRNLLQALRAREKQLNQ